MAILSAVNDSPTMVVTSQSLSGASMLYKVVKTNKIGNEISIGFAGISILNISAQYGTRNIVIIVAVIPQIRAVPKGITSSPFAALKLKSIY